MNIKEAQEAKHRLEEEITALLVNFELRTGLSIVAWRRECIAVDQRLLEKPDYNEYRLLATRVFLDVNL